MNRSFLVKLTLLLPSVCPLFESIDDDYSDIDALAMDDTARKLLSVEGDLYYFDDDVWIVFSTADGLAFENIRDIQIDGFGEKWIVNSAYDDEPQLCSLEDNGTPEGKTDDEWMTYTTNDGLAGPHVTDIVVDSNSDVWIATNRGISCLHVDR